MLPGDEQSTNLEDARQKLCWGAEWVLAERARYQLEVVECISALASAASADCQPLLAAELARSGLHIDRYRDDLWMTLTEALEASGSLAAASRALAEYRDILGELGLQPFAG